jgi:hypothetical protein
MAMWESWRTYISFVLVGAIFILCQALSGGVSGNQADGQSADPGDRSYRDTLRDETAGRGGITLAGDALLMVPAPRPARLAEERPQTN